LPNASEEGIAGHRAIEDACCGESGPRPRRHRLCQSACASPPATYLELLDPECSADFSAKPLICLRPMVNSAQIGSKLILGIDPRGIEFVHTSNLNCHGS
jgi:hypothetical protein